VTITAVTRAIRAGAVLNVVRVGSEEQESNYRNNTASALVRVTAPRQEAAERELAALSCRTLGATPRVLRAGETSVVRVTARNRFGKPTPGVAVRALGPGVDRRTKTDGRGVARFAVTPRREGIVAFRSARRALLAVGPRCRTLLGVLAASKTIVTG
jgi:hypothetical protein